MRFGGNAEGEGWQSTCRLEDNGKELAIHVSARVAPRCRTGSCKTHGVSPVARGGEHHGVCPWTAFDVADANVSRSLGARSRAGHRAADRHGKAGDPRGRIRRRDRYLSRLGQWARVKDAGVARTSGREKCQGGRLPEPTWRAARSHCPHVDFMAKQ